MVAIRKMPQPVGPLTKASYAPFNPMPMFRKTQLCKFYAKGRCQKGSDCVFAHGRRDLAEQPDFSCTSLCPYALRNMWCPNRTSCKFAHSDAELKPRLAVQDMRRSRQYFHEDAIVQHPPQPQQPGVLPASAWNLNTPTNNFSVLPALPYAHQASVDGDEIDDEDMDLQDEKPSNNGYWSRQTTAESLYGMQAAPGYALEFDEDDENDDMLNTEEEEVGLQGAAEPMVEHIASDATQNATCASSTDQTELPALPGLIVRNTFIDGIEESPAPSLRKVRSSPALLTAEDEVGFESEMSSCGEWSRTTTAESGTAFQDEECEFLYDSEESEDGDAISTQWTASSAELPATPGLIVRNTFIDGTEDDPSPVIRRVHSLPQITVV